MNKEDVEVLLAGPLQKLFHLELNDYSISLPEEQETVIS